MMKIARSADLTFCEGYRHDRRPCMKPLDARTGNHCNEHSIKIFKNARVNRQELAGNTSLFNIGDPTIKDPIEKRKYESNATYKLSNNIVIVAQGDKIHTKSPPKPTALREKSQQEKELM